MKRNSSKTMLATLSVAVAAVLLAGCSSPASMPEAGGFDSDAFAGEIYYDGEVFDGVAEQMDSSGATPRPLEEFEQADSGVAIIKNGEVSIRVADPGVAANEIADVAVGLGGSVSERDVYRDSDGDAASAYLLIRVPEARFDDAFEKFENVGEVQSDNRSETDVTLQRTDLKARIQALENSVERLHQLVTQADSVTDLIEVEAQLSVRQQELDSLKAQLTVLEDSVALSSIWVNLHKSSPIKGGSKGFLGGLKLGLESILAMFAGLTVFFGVVLPWALLVGLLVLLLIVPVRFIRRRKSSLSSGSDKGNKL